MINPWAIIGALLLAIGLAAGGYYEGWEKRGDHEDAIALKAKVLSDKAIAVEHARGDDLAGQLAVEHGVIHTVTVEVIKQVPKVTTIYKEAPDAPAQPIPAAVYTGGFVRLWNDAYANINLRDGTVDHADPSGDADIVKADISSQDILDNHIENAGRHAACYVALNKLIDFELGRPKPAQ